MTLDDFAAANEFAISSGRFGPGGNFTAPPGNNPGGPAEAGVEGVSQHGGNHDAYNTASPGFPWDQSGMTSGTGFTPGPAGVDSEEFERVLESIGMGGEGLSGSGFGSVGGDMWGAGGPTGQGGI